MVSGVFLCPCCTHGIPMGLPFLCCHSQRIPEAPFISSFGLQCNGGLTYKDQGFTLELFVGALRLALVLPDPMHLISEWGVCQTHLHVNTVEWWNRIRVCEWMGKAENVWGRTKGSDFCSHKSLLVPPYEFFRHVHRKALEAITGKWLALSPPPLWKQQHAWVMLHKLYTE